MGWICTVDGSPCGPLRIKNFKSIGWLIFDLRTNW
jgi:hypothetical protein